MPDSESSSANPEASETVRTGRRSSTGYGLHAESCPARRFASSGGGILEVMKPRSATTQRRPLAGSPFNLRPVEAIERFAVQDRVTHDKYGLGRVVMAEEAAVTVDFGSHQVRIVSPFHKLTKL